MFIFGRGGSAPQFSQMFLKEEIVYAKVESFFNQKHKILKLHSIMSSHNLEIVLEIRGAPGGAPMKSWDPLRAKRME